MNDERIYAYNQSEGNMNDYECSKCKNRGYFITTNSEGYDFLKECECMKIRRLNKLVKNCGLGDSLDRYKLENFKHDQEWQNNIYQSANRFLNSNANAFYIGGQVGCVDCDTEYFNGKKWVRIADYKDGDNVLQYTPTEKWKGRAELAKPLDYIKIPEDNMYFIKTARGSINQVLCKNHNFGYYTTKGNYVKKKFEEVIKIHNNTKQGFYGKIPTTFEYNGNGIDLTDEQIRIMVAIIADGSFRKKQNTCFVNLKKNRKKQRIEMLLNNANIKFKKWIKPNGYHCYNFYAPIKEKTYKEYWYNCTQHQLQVIADEVLHWDGHISGSRKTFSTTVKENADFIQFVFSAIGIRATISIQDRSNDTKRKRGIEYSVIISNNKFLQMTGNTKTNMKAEIMPYKTKDGYKYCFTMPSGNLVLRRNNRIFITGNCGKSHICTGIVRELVYKGYDCYYVVWSDIVTQLKQNIMEKAEEYDSKLNRMKEAEVLYIDDFFKNEPTRADIDNAFKIINYRYNMCRNNSNSRMKTIISSEKTLKDLVLIDEAIASRISEMAQGKFLLAIGKDPEKNMRFKQK